jgi:pimeloyl-ACP methyl ester carboxylesterase
MIMSRSVGDTKTPFTDLGRKLNLPCTAILSLQAPDPYVSTSPLPRHADGFSIPLLEDPAYSWYNTFTPLFEPLPDPSPSKPLVPLRKLLETLTSKEVGWQLHQIHLFGWGQGGTMALELALDIGKTEVNGRKRLGSIISICAGLLSHSNTPLNLSTPCLLFTRLDPKLAAGGKVVNGIKRAFGEVEVVHFEGKGEDMPRGKNEWEGIMKFWSKNLSRDDQGWKGVGEVYEVLR